MAEMNRRLTPPPMMTTLPMSPTTRVTTLANGATIASEDAFGATTAVGVAIATTAIAGGTTRAPSGYNAKLLINGLNLAGRNVPELQCHVLRSKAGHPDGKGPADLWEVAGTTPTAREVEALFPKKVTVRGAHLPLRTDAGVKKWDEEALHFTACNTERALWYFLSGKFPTRLHRRQLTGAEQSALEEENRRMRELARSFAGSL